MGEQLYRVIVSYDDAQPQDIFTGLTLAEAAGKLGGITSHVCWAQMHEETDMHRAHEAMALEEAEHAKANEQRQRERLARLDEHRKAIRAAAADGEAAETARFDDERNGV